MDGSKGPDDLLDLGWRDQPLGVARLVAMIRRQAGLVILTLLASIIFGSAYIVFAEPLYTASSSIFADVEGAEITEATSLVQLDTHVELIQSDKTTSAVISELGLDDLFASNPSILGRIVVDVRRWLKLESVESDSSDELAETIRAVKSGLNVKRVGNTAIISVSYTSVSKSLSVAIADAYASNYVAQVIERATQSAERRVRQLQERADEIRRRVSSANESVQQLRFQSKIVVADAEDLERQTAELRQRLSIADAEAAAVKAKLALISEAGDVQTLQTAALQTPEGVEIYNSLVSASRRLDQLRQQSGVSEATILQLEDAIADMRGVLERELRRSSDALELELAVITARQSSVIGDLNALSEYGASKTWSQLLDAERDVRVYEKIYEDYLDGLENFYRQPSRRSDVRLISEALLPLNPSFPRYKVILAIAGTIGAIAGVGLAMLREWTLSATPVVR